MKPYALLLFLFFSSSFILSDYNEPELIIINGASSSGKSTLARTLKTMLPDWEIAHYSAFRKSIIVAKAQELGLIEFSYKYKSMLDLFKDINYAIENADEYQADIKRKAWNNLLKSCYDLFADTVISLLAQNKKVIIDCNFYQKSSLLPLLTRLSDHKPFFVFAHLPFEKIPERVLSRNSNTDIEEYRYANQALFRYCMNYKGSPSNEHSHDFDHYARQKFKELIIEWTKDQEPYPFFPTGELLAHRLIRMLSLNEENTFLVPRLHHDCIVDTGSNNPEQAACLVRDAIRQHSRSVFFDNTIDLLCME